FASFIRKKRGNSKSDAGGSTASKTRSPSSHRFANFCRGRALDRPREETDRRTRGGHEAFDRPAPEGSGASCETEKGAWIEKPLSRARRGGFARNEDDDSDFTRLRGAGSHRVLLPCAERADRREGFPEDRRNLPREIAEAEDGFRREDGHAGYPRTDRNGNRPRTPPLPARP